MSIEIKEHHDREKRKDYVLINKKERKLHLVAGNVFRIKYNKQWIYVIRRFSWGQYYYTPFKYLGRGYDTPDDVIDTLKLYYVLWDDLENGMKQLCEKYKKYEQNNDYIPSAPDTSRFMATKRGDLGVERKYFKRGGTYGIDRYFPYILTIGTNVKELPHTFYDELYTLLTNALLSGCVIDDETPRIGSISGTAWVGIGLMI